MPHTGAGKFLSGDYNYVESEIARLVDTAGNVPLKVIMEVHYLNADQIKKACELCINGGAAFVKTGTGWSPSGAVLLAGSPGRDALRRKPQPMGQHDLAVCPPGSQGAPALVPPGTGNDLPA